MKRHNPCFCIATVYYFKTEGRFTWTAVIRRVFFTFKLFPQKGIFKEEMPLGQSPYK
jgi:hypothetical protein